MTEDTREGGAWIGQHPDENTEKVRRQLDESAERVAVSDNEAGASPHDEDSPDDDDIREAGQNR